MPGEVPLLPAIRQTLTTVKEVRARMGGSLLPAALSLPGVASARSRTGDFDDPDDDDWDDDDEFDDEFDTPRQSVPRTRQKKKKKSKTR